VRSKDSQAAPSVGFVPLRDGWVLPISPAEGKQEQAAKAMIRKAKAKAAAIATVGVDNGKNTFHLVDLDKRGAIVQRERLSRAQIGAPLANVLPA
jgi:hypothetical protein